MSLRDIIEQSEGRIELIDATPIQWSNKAGIRTKVRCLECDRVFDLLDETDAAE